jgi:hypothetical protein
VKPSLSAREEEALEYARRSRRDWRRFYSLTREEYVAQRSSGVSVEQADRWFDSPTGTPRLNEHFRIVRRLLADGRV